MRTTRALAASAAAVAALGLAAPVAVARDGMNLSPSNVVALPSVRTVGDYVRAGHDGRRLLAAIDALPSDVRTQGPVTFLPLPSHHSVSEFLIDYDISGALALRYHTGAPLPRAAALLIDEVGVRPESLPSLRGLSPSGTSC